MTEGKFKTIIFDFGGVIGQKSNNWNTTHNNISKLTGLSPEDLSSLSKKMWPDIETGKKNFHHFWAEVINSAPNKPTEEALEKAYESNFKEDKEVLEIAKKLKSKGFQMALLSNASKKWLDYKINKFHLKDIFEKFYNSAELGMVKPSPEIYSYAIKDLGVNANEIIFIDDLVENVRSANSLGINGILYKNPTRLKEDLETLLNTPL